MFDKWVCVFPGKMGISWKLAYGGVFSKEEAESYAIKYGNVVVVPLAFWEKYREYEHQAVVAKQKLIEVANLRLDYNEGNPTFTRLS